MREGPRASSLGFRPSLCAMSDLSIETNQLTKSFGSFTAVNALTLRSRGPKCVGFLGPNGAGKTTTLKILTAMVRPTSGTARINGIDVHSEKRKALYPCGVLIESPGSIRCSRRGKPSRTCVSCGASQPRSEPPNQGRARTGPDVGLDRQADGQIFEGNEAAGEHRRVAAARPRHPLAGRAHHRFDPRGMAEVRDIVLELKRQQKLIFMSSHLLGEVADFCDEVAMIDQGKLLIYDTIERVVERVSGTGAAVEIDIATSDLTVVEEKISAMPGVDHVADVDTRAFLIRFTAPPRNFSSRSWSPLTWAW